MLIINKCPICGDSESKSVKDGGFNYQQNDIVCGKCEDNGKNPYKITMLYKTSDRGYRPCHTHFVSTKSVANAFEFLRKNSTTMGFSVQNAYNPETKHVISVMVKGKLGKRLIKKFLELGYSDWLYSHAFSAKTFMTPDGQILNLKKEDDLDLVSNADLMPWARAFGYAQ